MRLLSLMALASFSFPRVERWERPTAESFKASKLHCGLLLQGPELKFGLCTIMSLSLLAFSRKSQKTVTPLLSRHFFNKLTHIRIATITQDGFCFPVDGAEKKTYSSLPKYLGVGLVTEKKQNTIFLPELRSSIIEMAWQVSFMQ